MYRSKWNSDKDILTLVDSQLVNLESTQVKNLNIILTCDIYRKLILADGNFLGFTGY